MNHPAPIQDVQGFGFIASLISTVGGLVAGSIKPKVEIVRPTVKFTDGAQLGTPLIGSQGQAAQQQPPSIHPAAIVFGVGAIIILAR